MEIAKKGPAMITLGLVNELKFVENHFGGGLKCEIEAGGRKINLSFQEDIIEIFYKDVLIWKERLDQEGAWFGIESCDNVFKIINCIDSGDDSWREKYFWEPRV